MVVPSASYAFWPFSDDAIDYEMVIEGLEPALIEEYALEQTAKQAIDAENPPTNLAELRAASFPMAERLRAMLESRAYYDAKVSARVDDRGEDALALITFTATSGVRYTVSENDLLWGSPPLEVDNETPHKLLVGEYAESRPILEHAAALKTKYAKERCFLTLNVTPTAELDHVAHLAKVEHNINYGAEANFGETLFAQEDNAKGRVDKDIMEKMVKWKQGECFDIQKVTATQAAFLKSQLFASVDIDYPDTPDDLGQVPMKITVKERAHRTISAGASYAFDEGFGVKSSWEHRNLRHRADKLHVKTHLSQLESGLSGDYTLPYFYHDRQKLRLSSSIQRETTDSYDSNNISALAEISRKMTDTISLGIGAGARFSRIDEAGERTENFGLVFLTAHAEYDSRNDPLDPTSGIHARASITPFTDVTGQGIGFTRSDIAGSTYFTADALKWTPTLALRGAYGQINGASAESVPADLRFYSGGGGSVRGYNYRAIGPRDDGEAQGGTAWTEFSTELRLRFTEDFGGVAFIDAGNTYDASVVDPSEELFFSAGLGVRYYSPIGPLRFDVGVPLDEVEDDAPFGVYVSIGQAF